MPCPCLFNLYLLHSYALAMSHSRVRLMDRLGRLLLMRLLRVRLDRGECLSLDGVQLPIFAVHRHQLLVCPTLHKPSVPEAPVRPHTRQHTSRVGSEHRAGETRGACGALRGGVREQAATTYRMRSACLARWPNRCVMKIRVRRSRLRRWERMPDEVIIASCEKSAAWITHCLPPGDQARRTVHRRRSGLPRVPA